MYRRNTILSNLSEKIISTLSIYKKICIQAIAHLLVSWCDASTCDPGEETNVNKHWRNYTRVFIRPSGTPWLSPPSASFSRATLFFTSPPSLLPTSSCPLPHTPFFWPIQHIMCHKNCPLKVWPSSFGYACRYLSFSSILIVKNQFSIKLSK